MRREGFRHHRTDGRTFAIDQIGLIEFQGVPVPEIEVGCCVRRRIETLDDFTREFFKREVEVTSVAWRCHAVRSWIIPDAPAIRFISFLEEKDKAVCIQLRHKNHLSPLTCHNRNPPDERLFARRKE
jgi:hypothetical protein